METNQLNIEILNENEPFNEIQSNDFSNYGKNAPPSYEETNNVLNPTSNNFYKSIKYARETGNNTYKLLSKVATFFCCSLTITIILAILMALPIIMITIGSLYLKGCTIQKMIPIWLIVFGSLLIVKNISTLVQRINSINKGDEKGSSTAMNVFDSFMSLFIVIWFICGNIWTFSIVDIVQYNDKLDVATYCSKTTYLFSFWLITSIYILIGVSCLAFCVTVCLTIFIPTKN